MNYSNGIIRKLLDQPDQVNIEKNKSQILLKHPCLRIPSKELELSSSPAYITGTKIPVKNVIVNQRYIKNIDQTKAPVILITSS